jgi:GDP-4-dehydro-6-deoxy-D-mannose reductase
MISSLITGINGFVGKHLCEFLKNKGHVVSGLDIQKKSEISDITYFAADICDGDAVSNIIEKIKPDEIYHLAAISFPKEANISPRRALKINIMGTVSVIDAMRRFCPGSKFLFVGSAKEYGTIQKEIFTEEDIPSPSDFYGASKYSSELICRQYFMLYDLDVRFTRSFNHTGPGQSSNFVCSDWARQVAMAECGKGPSQISVGNLDVEIDFLDVRDVVNAYWHIMEKGQKGRIYNVCSGKTQKLCDILDFFVKKSTKNIKVIRDKNKIAAIKENKALRGDNTRLCTETGWTINYPLEKTLKDLYDYWIDKIRAGFI